MGTLSTAVELWTSDIQEALKGTSGYLRRQEEGWCSAFDRGRSAGELVPPQAAQGQTFNGSWNAELGS